MFSLVIKCPTTSQVDFFVKSKSCSFDFFMLANLRFKWNQSYWECMEGWAFLLTIIDYNILNSLSIVWMFEFGRWAPYSTLWGLLTWNLLWDILFIWKYYRLSQPWINYRIWFTWWACECNELQQDVQTQCCHPLKFYKNVAISERECELQFKVHQKTCIPIGQVAIQFAKGMIAKTRKIDINWA